MGRTAWKQKQTILLTAVFIAAMACAAAAAAADETLNLLPHPGVSSLSILRTT